MGRLNAPLLVLALGAVAAMALASCGSGGGAELLPGDTAQEINSNLDQVKTLAEEGECIGAEDAARQVSAQVDALGGVDKRLKQALREGAARLNEVVAGCEEAPEETEAIETAEEPQPPEKKAKPEKPEKTKPEKPPKETPAETTPETPVTPPASGEGNEEGSGEAPPGEGGGTPSGGVGPGAPAESE